MLDLPDEHGYRLSFCCDRDGIDENNALEVARLLAYFRALQQRLDLSVVLVHHTRKNAAGGAAAGQGLRGSSDIHAFGDSNLYLRRTRERLVLALLAQGEACTRTKLRNSLSVKNERLGDALQSLEQAGRIRRNSTGWQRID